jgi:hypothetical protein
MSSSLPISILAILGLLISLLGLFAAGELVMVALGLAAVFGAGVLGVIANRRA